MVVFECVCIHIHIQSNCVPQWEKMLESIVKTSIDEESMWNIMKFFIITGISPFECCRIPAFPECRIPRQKMIMLNLKCQHILRKENEWRTKAWNKILCANSECTEVEFPVDLINRNLQVFYAYPNVIFMGENQHWST